MSFSSVQRSDALDSSVRTLTKNQFSTSLDDAAMGRRSLLKTAWGRSSALSNPQDLGTLDGRLRWKDGLDKNNPSDLFQFELNTNSRVDLLLDSASNKVKVNLFAEDGSGIRSIKLSRATQRSETKVRRNLAAGTYFVEVSTTEQVESNYRLTLTADIAGDRLAGADDLGTLSESKQVSDFVGDRDEFDFYRFNLSEARVVELSLNGLSADADLGLIQDRNNNRRIDAGEILAASVKGGDRSELVRSALDAGEYFVVVRRFEGETNYNLELSSTGTAEDFSPSIGYGLVDAAAAVAKGLGRKPFERSPERGFSWEIDMINAPEVWQQGFTGKDIVVAVLDTGVDYTHEDLNDNIWKNSFEIEGNGIDDDNNGFVDDIRGWSFAENSNNPMDREGHGTHVAGTIGAEKNNFGITGVAYDAKIMPVKVLGDDGSGSEADIVAGIYYAVNNGADVINLSLGSDFPSPAERKAIKYAYEQGVVVVMASGNSGKPLPGYPARYATDYGISVGAVDQNFTLADFTNKAGIPLDYVVAPGVKVNSTKPGNSYQFLDGTSMASPHVAGIAALILSSNPGLTAGQVEDLITGTADVTKIKA